MLSKIGVIGRTAEGTSLCDGQTIKTRILVDELKAKYPSTEIIIADTYNFKKNYHSLLKSIIRCMRESNVVFILLSRNGRRIIFPIVNFLNLFFKKPIIHDVIGGGSEELIRKYPTLKWHYNQFTVNWVESLKLVDRLKELGIDNAEYLPNFKRLSCISSEEIKPHEGAIYKFCTFSRVTREKGIGIASQAIIDINRKAGSCKAVLDIYGPIEDGYEEELQRYVDSSDGAVNYKGIVDYNDSVSVLNNYYMLLFPTSFYGEGFPGTLIDAFSAGLPVIATDWHYNGEIISYNITGFLYATDEAHRLKELIEYSMNHPDLINAMRYHCLTEAKKYSADTVMEIISRRIDSLAHKKDK